MFSEHVRTWFAGIWGSWNRMFTDESDKHIPSPAQDHNNTFPVYKGGMLWRPNYSELTLTQEEAFMAWNFWRWNFKSVQEATDLAKRGKEIREIVLGLQREERARSKGSKWKKNLLKIQKVSINWELFMRAYFLLLLLLSLALALQNPVILTGYSYQCFWRSTFQVCNSQLRITSLDFFDV